MRIERLLRSRSGRRGFTLIEVIVTLGIVGIMMAAIYECLFKTLQAKRISENAVAGSRVGPLLLDQIERDVKQLFAYNIAHGKVLSTKDDRINGMDADRISLVSATQRSTSALVLNRHGSDKVIFSNVNEVGYTLTANKENPDFLVLWRREDFYVDDDPLKGGKAIKLYQRVRGFNIAYYGSLEKDAERKDDWDLEKEKHLPAAMEITLSLEVEPRNVGDFVSAEELERRQYTFKRWIVMPTDLASIVAVRPNIPSAVSDDGSSPFGKHKDGDGDDKDGGDGKMGGGDKGKDGKGGSGGGNSGGRGPLGNIGGGGPRRGGNAGGAGGAGGGGGKTGH